MTLSTHQAHRTTGDNAMKNYAEQQMGAVLNLHASQLRMDRTMATSTAEIPEDIDRIATDIVRADYSKDEQEPDWLLYKAIAKAILAERQRDQWQPIETAPKDGTDILVADDGRQGVEMVSWKGGAKKGGWHTEDGRASYTTDFFTHWQPLPYPPKVSE